MDQPKKIPRDTYVEAAYNIRAKTTTYHVSVQTEDGNRLRFDLDQTNMDLLLRSGTTARRLGAKFAEEAEDFGIGS